MEINNAKLTYVDFNDNNGKQAQAADNQEQEVQALFDEVEAQATADGDKDTLKQLKALKQEYTANGKVNTSKKDDIKKLIQMLIKLLQLAKIKFPKPKQPVLRPIHPDIPDPNPVIKPDPLKPIIKPIHPDIPDPNPVIKPEKPVNDITSMALGEEGGDVGDISDHIIIRDPDPYVPPKPSDDDKNELAKPTIDPEKFKPTGPGPARPKPHPFIRPIIIDPRKLQPQYDGEKAKLDDNVVTSMAVGEEGGFHAEKLNFNDELTFKQMTQVLNEDGTAE